MTRATITYDGIESSDSSGPNLRARPQISTLGIVTADRPMMLERCLGSYITHVQLHGRSPRIVIVDDSRRAANAVAVRRIAGNAARRYAGVIQYVGADEKAGAQKILKRAGIARAVLDFGLPTRGDGFAPGANRNHLLLATAGELLLKADDDTLCETWSADGETRGVAFTGHADPRQHTFFTTRRQALSAAHWVDVDFLSAHEAMLGQTLTNIATEADDLTHACKHIVQGVRSENPSYKIRMTSSGVAGDSAMYTPHRLLFNPATASNWTTLDATTFKRMLATRETLRIVPRATVTHQSSAMTYSVGLDNRTLMPPFTPVGANEDGLFGVILRLIAPMTFLAYIPIGIVHDSHRSPKYDSAPMLCASQTRIAELTIGLLHGWNGRATSRAAPSRGLRSLGQHFIDLGNMAPDDFAHHVVTTALDLWARERDRLDATIASTPGLPPFWLSELARYRQRFLDSAKDPDFFVPIELKRSRSTTSGFRRWQVYVGNLGQLMRAWPEIWTTARREGLYRPA